ncbi:hypothetical protein DESC_610333 [Desulfosarcina cetonica]|nr:hypothetical protein DESC_610333 [Desulfosarcina cetonica]
MQQGWLTRAVVILAMIGLLGFSPIPGFAQDAGPDFSNPPAADRHGPRPGGFEKDDVNKDGQVTRAEFSGPKEMFSHLDANGDGVITREEVKPRKPPAGQPNLPEPPSN